MSNQPSPNPALRQQSCPAALADDDAALAAALQAIFADDIHAFDAVAAALQTRGIKRPSGNTEAWSVAALTSELARINGALDSAYARDGIGA